MNRVAMRGYNKIFKSVARTARRKVRKGRTYLRKRRNVYGKAGLSYRANKAFKRASL